ncbi:MAG: DUF1552 domain-containing protein [Polyangiaceae bacterium]|nr:DUF1552 domain-containing protein [Polyangiaceae bacterium]
MRSSSRRQFLRGAAGFTLALPVLDSLLVGREARAGSFTTKRFVAMTTAHGAIWGSNMYPGDGVLSDSTNYKGRNVRRGDLVPDVSDGIAALSPVLTASSSKLTTALASKMNVLRGLDIMFNIGHHGGGHLGNFASTDENVSFDQRPTIDQVMAWSPSFYPNLGSILVRSMNIGTGVFSYLGEYDISYGYSNPQDQSGSVESLALEHNSMSLFEKIFVPPDEQGMPERPLIVDRVLEDYKRLRNGNRRLSSSDRQRLDDHIARLDELERKLNVTASCGDVAPPSQDTSDVYDSEGYFLDYDKHAQYWSLFNDVIVAAFACDTSRIATMEALEQFSSFAGDWHNDIAHQANLPDGEAQGTLWIAQQRFFEGVFLDLATKLDAVQEADGTTLLDNTLVQWTQESGPIAHSSISHPVVTAGGAGGAIKTGNYIDYQNHNQAIDSDIPPEEVVYAGLPYNQWLSNVLQVMGVPTSEFDPGDDGGYGDAYTDSSDLYSSTVRQNMNEKLPYL